MGKYYDLAEQTFGNWFVLYRNGSTDAKAAIWHCRCKLCGTEHDIVGAALRNGTSTQCLSCSAKQTRTKPFSKDPIKTIFMGMKQRCYNSSHEHYKDYGGKNIKICDEWLNNPQSFYEWAYLNGYAVGKSIDRRNNSLDYSPANCHFIERNKQCRNRSNSIMIKINGDTKCLQEWCDIYKINRETVRSRVKRYGISWQEALTRPIEK